MSEFRKWFVIILIIWMKIEKNNTQRICPIQEAILPCRCLVRGGEYQIWCSHSDLPRVLEGLKAISEYIKDPIDELILENNYLPSLPGRAFASLKILRLMLRYNGLERVSSDWLAGLQSLVEIFIVEPQLRSLPDDSLTQLNALQAITIQTALLKRLPLFSGLPKLHYLQIESASLQELSPTNFKYNPNLEKVHITMSTKVSRLEANLFFDLPNLSLLNMSFCGISWIHPRAFRELPLLKELWLIGNKITDASMMGRASRDLPQLELIRLDNNFIDKLGEAAFVDLPSLKKLYLTNNRITELNHGAFHMVPQLRTLDLNKNMLQRVHPESFLQHSGSGLEELYLVENDISHVADLRSLLDALPRLVFLDMRFNNLKTIPFGALRGHPTLEYLNLDYNKLQVIDREAFMAMPALRELRLKNNSLSDILEPPFWNLPALKGLDLSGNYFKLLLPIFFANLPSLRRIDLSNNELTIIDPELFVSTPSLEHINISDNHITAIHPATFRHLLNLYELDISHNHLLEFVPGLPRSTEYLHLHHNKIEALPVVPSPNLDLPALRALDLSNNNIQTIPKSSLRTMPQLKKLYIGKNLLQSITENSLVGLTQLETLHLHGNVIAHIHPNAFKATEGLKELNLNNNRLDILVPDLFKDTPLLKTLDLSGNQLAEILPGTLDKNLELQKIDASYNVLVHLPITLYGLKNLKYLDLTSNRIKNIDAEIIASLLNLRELKLSKNFVQELRLGSFTNLPYLKTLYLDSNEIEFMDSNSIANLPVLKSVKLNKNIIKQIPNSAFRNLSSLQVIELQDNELRHIAPNAFDSVPQMLMLNLSNNNLADLEDAGLSGLKSLEVLDIRNNRIAKLTSSSLEKMEWLVELRIDDNDICGIQESSFNTMPRLRVIGLKNNKLTSFPEQALDRLRSNIAILDVEGNPLICGCNLMWLQTWLHETSQKGPHCLDGTPLREVQLSREECAQQNRLSEVVAPGCDAEFLTSLGAHTTSQVFSNWMELKSIKNNTLNKANHKNNVAPSPEESEYFYDEYVDYPYNESMVDSNGLVNEKFKYKDENIKTVTVKVPISTKSPHYTTGDTPTIYAAASKNITKKPNIPPKVNNSPSTSGFTFFGVPLPNLNLNSLLGRGNGRLESKLPTASVSAERKIAIVNKPDISTGRPGIGMGAAPPSLPLKMQPPPPAYKQPPSIPEIQTGFIPVLPGYGGFKPIPDPSIPMRHTSSNINDTPISKHDKNVDSTTLSSANNTSENRAGHFLDVTSTLPPPFIKSENISTISTSTSKYSDYNKMSKNFSFDLAHETTTDSFPETTTIIEETTSFGEVRYAEKINSKLPVTTTEFTPIITTEELEIITTSSPKYIATVEVVKNTSSGVFKTMHIDKRYEEFTIEKDLETPATPLINPNKGSQAQLKHSGKSTITKVASPHIANPLQTPILETSNILNPLPHRENTYDYFSNPTTEQVNKDDTNWYFANYNKTNLEPYVARITNNNCAENIFGHYQCLQIILTVFYIELIL